MSEPTEVEMSAQSGRGAGRLLMQEIYARLRDEILTCQLAPGQRINISELADSYSVSLSAVREALSRLHSEDLVQQIPQRGYRVATVDKDGFQQLTDARVEVECACLRQAMALGDVNWETDIVAARYRMQRLPVSHPDEADQINPDWARAHAEFHSCLVAACRNEWLLRFRQMLFDHSERYRRLVVPRQSVNRDIRGEHERLTEAVIGRDIERAQRLMEDHLRATAQDTLIRSALDRHAG